MRPTMLVNSLIALAVVIGAGLIIANALDTWGYEGQPVNQYLTDSQTLEIKQELTLGQTFMATENNLQRIDVILRTYSRRNTEDVTFYLKSAPDSPEIIYQETFNASTVGNNQWHRFEFPPIADSAGREFFFYFASPTSTDGNAITIGGAVGDFYEKGQVYLGPVPTNEGDLAFRAYYGLSTTEKLSRFAARLVEDKPSLWGDIGFYGVLLLLYGLFAIRIIAELVREDEA